MINKYIVMVCPCCNTEIIIDKTTGEISGGFSCLEVIEGLDTLKYEFGEVNGNGRRKDCNS